jgi:hypothetical protein
MRTLFCDICGEPTPRRNNFQRYCRECAQKPRSWQKAYIGYGRKPPDKWIAHFACAICGEIVPRRSGPQKYCDRCRQIGTSRKVAKYYQKHKKKILRNKAKYRASNSEMIIKKQRQYHQDTKGERLTKDELEIAK